MKFEKAVVTRIKLEEDDIIITSSTSNPASDCSNAASNVAARCTTDSYKSYQTCPSNALFYH